jgi:inorganic pyrophosphatase
MQITKHPKEFEKLEIQAYQRPQDIRSLRKTHVAFSGSPRKHRYDADRVMLQSDPFSEQNLYYEFKKSDIAFIEELPSLVNLEGETIAMIRLWIKKGSIAVRYAPFIVGDTQRI